MAITFRVSPVDRAEAPLQIPPLDGPLKLLGEPVEAMGASVSSFLPGAQHGLLRAIHTSYALHYPLALSPDAVWLTIAQGFARHIGANAEELRGYLVEHEGKAKIEIRRDDFVKGSRENPWPEAFSAFSDAIAEHIGRSRDLLVCDFSTTGPVERAASEVVLLDAMSSYFEYSFLTMCGIPEITLEGTAEDWRSVRRRARTLAEYGLEWWLKGLDPVLYKLIETAEGRVEIPFWERLFKHADGSGGPWVRGWINTLFPYLRAPESDRLVKNPHLTKWAGGFDEYFGGGPKTEEIPSGLSKVPFVWQYFEDRYDMHFLGGFVGIAQDAATLTVRPAIGWGVQDVAEASRATPAARRFPSTRRWNTDIAGILLWGRVSRRTFATGDEIGRIIEEAQAIARRGGLRLTCVPVGDFSQCELFPEAPVRCRFVLGIPVCQGGFRDAKRVARAELDASRSVAHSVPEEIWRELDALVHGLSGSLELSLAALHPYARTMLTDESGLGAPIVEVHGGEGRLATVDPSRIPDPAMFRVTFGA